MHIMRIVEVRLSGSGGFDSLTFSSDVSRIWSVRSLSADASDEQQLQQRH